jgi:glycosyltransferase involved in cell wall biosynthesis
MGIRGFANAARTLEDIELVIIGSGKDKKRLHKICCDEGIANKTKFMGKVSHEKYRMHLKESSIILNLALKEGGVTFFFDALSAGKPIINLIFREVRKSTKTEVEYA